MWGHNGSIQFGTSYWLVSPLVLATNWCRERGAFAPLLTTKSTIKRKVHLFFRRCVPILLIDLYFNCIRGLRRNPNLFRSCCYLLSALLVPHCDLHYASRRPLLVPALPPPALYTSAASVPRRGVCCEETVRSANRGRQDSNYTSLTCIYIWKKRE